MLSSTLVLYFILKVNFCRDHKFWCFLEKEYVEMYVLMRPLWFTQFCVSARF